MVPITSFIRWAGGKSWLVPYVAQLTEGLDYNNYYEPIISGSTIYYSFYFNGNHLLNLCLDFDFYLTYLLLYIIKEVKILI